MIEKHIFTTNTPRLIKVVEIKSDGTLYIKAILDNDHWHIEWFNKNGVSLRKKTRPKCEHMNNNLYCTLPENEECIGNDIMCMGIKQIKR